MFSPYEYTWTTTGPGLVMIGTFVATFLAVVGSVYATYPEKPAFPREFEDGLQRELGGANAVRVSLERRSILTLHFEPDIDYESRPGKRVIPNHEIENGSSVDGGEEKNNCVHIQR